MKLQAINCPNCGGSLEIDDGLDTFFCKYCGSKIVLNGQSSAAYNAKTRIKEMEHEERMADKRYSFKKEIAQAKIYKETFKHKKEIICAVIFFSIISLFFASMKISSNLEEKKLEQLVISVQNLIDEEEFDKAYVKAKTIYYTSNWSDEIEDKWDETRRALIDQIIEAEEEATGESKHKPEKKGWFD